MTYSFEKFPGEPIVLLTLTEEFDIGRDMPQAVREQNELMDSLDEDLYFVVNATSLKYDFGSLVSGLALAARGEAAALQHPRIKKAVLVGAAGLIKLAAEAFGQTQYGGLSVAAYDTLDEAFAAIRSEIAGW
jgi:pimeloyl-ACP methyl ester carboxylesterase